MRVYAELMTKFDNPKFPDQLGSSGWRQEDYRVPLGESSSRESLLTSASPAWCCTMTANPAQGTAAPHPCAVLRSADTTHATSRCSGRSRGARLGRENEAGDDDVRWLDGRSCKRAISATLARINRSTLQPARGNEYHQARGRARHCRASRRGWRTSGPALSSRSSRRGDCLRSRDSVDAAATSRCCRPVIKTHRNGAAAGSNSPMPSLHRAIRSPRASWSIASGIISSAPAWCAASMISAMSANWASHPELLDYLAVIAFVAEGWSIKKLIRPSKADAAFPFLLLHKGQLAGG